MRRLVLIAAIVCVGVFAGHAAKTDAAAKVRACAGPCIATLSGFGNLHWPNSRKDISFTTPRSFGVQYSYNACEKGRPGFRLTLHARGTAIPLVVAFESSGHGTATWNAGHDMTWKPQVVSRCRWSFTVTAMSKFDAASNPPTATATQVAATTVQPTETPVAGSGEPSAPTQPSVPAQRSAATSTPVPTATPDLLNTACTLGPADVFLHRLPDGTRHQTDLQWDKVGGADFAGNSAPDGMMFFWTYATESLNGPTPEPSSPYQYRFMGSDGTIYDPHNAYMSWPANANAPTLNTMTLHSGINNAGWVEIALPSGVGTVTLQWQPAGTGTKWYDVQKLQFTPGILGTLQVSRAGQPRSCDTLLPVPTASPTPVPTSTLAYVPPTSTPTPGPNTHNVQVSAWVSDPTPKMDETVKAFAQITDNGHQVPGVEVDMTWHSSSASLGCSAITDGTGTASCAHAVSEVSNGSQVYINVVFNRAGATYNSGTSFTPQ